MKADKTAKGALPARLPRPRIRLWMLIAGSLAVSAGLVLAARGALAARSLSDPGAETGATIAGTVYQDFNADGHLSAALSPPSAYGGPAVDTGYPGLPVTATGADGMVVTTTTDASGRYTLTGLISGAPYRLEFGIPSGFEAAPHGQSLTGTASGTSLQFVAGGAQNVNFGLLRPCDYCQNDPLIVMPAYVNGPVSETLVFVSDALVKFPYTAGGYYPFGSNTPTAQRVATGGQLGATWGVAHHKATRKVFTAAFMKRFAAFGPGGPGAIYVSDPHALTTGAQVFFDVSTLLGPDAAGVNPHPTGAPDPYLDAPSYDAVGKMGLANLKLSEDQLFLYTINLSTTQLLMLNIGDPPAPPTALATPGATPGPGEMGVFDIPSPCSNADINARPFALGEFRGKVYVGGVCTGESTQLATNVPITESANYSSELSLYVYEFDPATGLFASTPVLQAPLDYPRKCAIDADNDGLCEFDATWRPWRPTFPTFTWNTNPSSSATGIRNATPVFIGEIAYPEPWLTDIEFNLDGAMMLGLRDRFPDQHGFNSPDPLESLSTATYYLYAGATSTQPPRIVVPQDHVVLYSADGAGDLLRACPTPGGGWALENNASCSSGPTGGAGNGQGPGGGSYFYHDGYLPDAGHALHDGVALGGVAVGPGFPDVVTSVYNPYQPWSSGTRWFSDREGFETKAYQVYATQANAASPVGQPFGKGNGLGDLALVCDDPPVEIGNRVWFDLNQNGIQDPGEAPIAGVTVRLYDAAGNVVATTTTNAEGVYFFSSAGPDGIAFTSDDLASYGPDGVPNTSDDKTVPGFKPSTLGVTNVYTIALDYAPDFQPGPVPAANGPLYGFYPTVPLSGLSQLDSNGLWLAPQRVSSGPIVAGSPGWTDHSIDFGFVASPPLTITKANKDDYPLGPELAVAEGSVIIYTFRVTNTGAVTVPAVVVTDTVPFGTAFKADTASPVQVTGPDPLVWNVGDMAPGAVFIVRFSVVVLPTSGGTITNTGYVNGLQSNQVLNIKEPTSIELVSFDARREAGSMTVRWRTSLESNTLGFRLFRSTTADFSAAALATPQLIAATASGQGADYAWVDAAAPVSGSVYYWLQDVATTGETFEYGPVQATGLPGWAAYLPFIAR